MAQSQSTERANILLVDDQPAKLMSYELILAELNHNLLKASSAKEALEILLKTDVAVILVDVCMPEFDGFELAQMIRAHPRFEQTAIIFISAIHLSELDSLKGYEMGAVDYVPVPVVPGVLRAKVRVFVDLYRKTRELAKINNDLEARVAERTSALQAAIARQELLAREVDHRARNSLAVIQAIVSMTPQTSAPEFARAVDGRIRAMARAHTLLSQSRWQGADLARLVREELEPYEGGGRVSVDGAAIMIKPTIAQNLALSIHELATNAAKYGALSAPDGRLFVSWSIAGDALTLEWVERGGPPATKPQRTGFGAKVIGSSVKALDGALDYDWRAEGLRCVLHMPMANFEPPQHDAPPTRGSPHEHVAREGERPLQGRRAFVVEDEPLVAMAMVRRLAELGAQSIGPFGSLAEAFEALSAEFDVAILDVNVAGELVYPLAAALAERGKPFIFITGYEAQSIDTRFAAAPVLAKPIEDEHLVDALCQAIRGATPREALAS